MEEITTVRKNFFFSSKYFVMYELQTLESQVVGWSCRNMLSICLPLSRNLVREVIVCMNGYQKNIITSLVKLQGKNLLNVSYSI